MICSSIGTLIYYTNKMKKSKSYFVYLLLCSDKSIYTGITTDVKKRIEQHNKKKGAKYTRGRTPVSLLKSFKVKNKSIALKAEILIKKLSRKDKLYLINNFKP